MVEEEKPDEQLLQQSEKKKLPISIDQLQNVWNDFTELEKNKGNDLVLVTLKKELGVKNNTEIHLALANHLEIDALNSIKQDLTTYLRQKLDNDFIEIIADVNEEKVIKKAYTNADKFEQMMKKQPLLKELKDRLGLDPDH